MAESKTHPTWASLVLSAAFVLWLGGVGYGFWTVGAYQNQPGKQSSPAGWPSDSRLPRVDGEHVLVLFAHPKCPCTRASLGELAKILTHTNQRLAAHVVFIKPERTPEGWERTDLWATAESTPGVTCWTDHAGIEAKRFGAATSGMTYLFAPQGNLVFRGGVTATRGHHGDNDAADSVIALVNSQTAICSAAEVFGCPLFQPN